MKQSQITYNMIKFKLVDVLTTKDRVKILILSLILISIILFGGYEIISYICIDNNQNK